TRSDRDWSSDVCSSDLYRPLGRCPAGNRPSGRYLILARRRLGAKIEVRHTELDVAGHQPLLIRLPAPSSELPRGEITVEIRTDEIGRASCRERRENAAT